MNKIPYCFFLFFTLVAMASCIKKTADVTRTPILEVEGKFLYLDEIQQIIPQNIDKKDSIEIAQSFIRKWVTDVLLYENAKRNITNKNEIDELVDSYRKSLVIHQYQQKMIEQRLPKESSEEDIQAFYKEYSKELVLKENIIKGILLILPAKAPQLGNVRGWMRSANTKSLESIEKYSVRNAISYDYFGDKWISLTQILKKIPVQVKDPTSFISSNQFVETSDSTHHYLLRIQAHKFTGDVEPYEMAKDRIANILLNKSKTDFIAQFEKELYDDAVKNEDVSFFKR